MNKTIHILAFSISVTPIMALAEEQSLDSAANDPTASVMSLQFQDFYSSAYYNLPGVDGNNLQFRAAIPFALWGYNHIARITAPVVTESPSGASGLSDLTVFDLVTFEKIMGQIWGRGRCSATNGQGGT